MVEKIFLDKNEDIVILLVDFELLAKSKRC